VVLEVDSNFGFGIQGKSVVSIGMDAKMDGEESQSSYNGTTRTLPEGFEGTGAVSDEQSPGGHLLANQLAEAERQLEMLQRLKAVREESTRLMASLGQ
jgi:hypothetical protein